MSWRLRGRKARRVQGEPGMLKIQQTTIHLDPDEIMELEAIIPIRGFYSSSAPVGGQLKQ
jgi:hypothetical protein